MNLGAALAFWQVAYPGLGQAIRLDARICGFMALGGVACRGTFGNMNTAVGKARVGKGRLVNARFVIMCKHNL